MEDFLYDKGQKLVKGNRRQYKRIYIADTENYSCRMQKSHCLGHKDRLNTSLENVLLGRILYWQEDDNYGICVPTAGGEDILHVPND